jgi:hypothetical protein
VELKLHHLLSVHRVEAILSERLDAGFGEDLFTSVILAKSARVERPGLKRLLVDIAAGKV